MVRPRGSVPSPVAVSSGATSSNRPANCPVVRERVEFGSGAAGLMSALMVHPPDASRTALFTPDWMTAEIWASSTITSTTMQYIAKVAPVRNFRDVG